jgi:hypothetical protein
MVLPLSYTQKITQARSAILALKSRQDITAILRCHHPKPAFKLDFDHIRSPNQMAVTKPPILIFPLVAKHHTDACPRPD